MVWAPKHKHEKEFRLVVGDLSEQETVLRLHRLDRVKVYPNKIIARQSEDAIKEGEPEPPEEINSPWMKGWDEEDIVSERY